MSHVPHVTVHATLMVWLVDAAVELVGELAGLSWARDDLRRAWLNTWTGLDPVLTINWSTHRSGQMVRSNSSIDPVHVLVWFFSLLLV